MRTMNMFIGTMSTTTRFAEKKSKQEDDGIFFETFERIPSSVSFSFRSVQYSDTENDDDIYDDSRASFVSAVATPSLLRKTFGDDVIHVEEDDEEDDEEEEEEEDYSIWLEEPMSIKERRQKLLREMGVSGRRSVAISSRPIIESTIEVNKPVVIDLPSPVGVALSTAGSTRVRSRSDIGVSRWDPINGGLSRTCSAPPFFRRRGGDSNSETATAWRSSSTKEKASLASSVFPRICEEHGGGIEHLAKNDVAPFYTITNLDTGKEFVINLENGNLNSKICDPQTGDELTMDEFEESVGHSPMVKQVMRREKDEDVDVGVGVGLSKKKNEQKGEEKKKKKTTRRKRGVTWLKNITRVGNNSHSLLDKSDGSNDYNASVIGATEADEEGNDEQHQQQHEVGNKDNYSSLENWMKVHKKGKAFKDLTGLYMSQEMKDAHQGSIWTMRFSSDGLLMASAGEDTVIHVWQVLECDSLTSSQTNVGTLPHNLLMVDDEQATTTVENRSQSQDVGSKLKKGKSFSSGKGTRKTSIPDHVVVPETIFSLSDQPYCSFHGHQEGVLDLSWSKSSKKHLLSSSMDKTVRLWDMETKTCLNLFKHNNYVTSIQFNPIDDRYFISGSLDAKVRIWSIPDHQVIEWKDLNDMVTAVSYTPDGDGALVGTHNGTCRLYNMSDGDKKLRQKAELDLRFKKKKSHSKEITGFQFSPGNPSELLITSADSRIRVFVGVDLVYKFKGFRNTRKQISAGFTPNAHHVVCASDDSHVYIWKREESKKPKSWVTTHAHERFHCKDVSVALPWPGSCKHTTPSNIPPLLSSSRCIQRSESNDSVQEPPSTTTSTTHHREIICNSLQTNATSSMSHSINSNSNSWLSKSGPLSSVHGFSLPYSSHLSARWHNIGGNNKVSSSVPDATAWGLVLVTASLEGEIRVHQNFGLPIRLNR